VCAVLVAMRNLLSCLFMGGALLRALWYSSVVRAMVGEYCLVASHSVVICEEFYLC
jgi:hypothetical protein